MTGPIETELKLEVDPADRARIALAELFSETPSAADHLVAAYFDTPHRHVRGAGYSLRVRREGAKRVQTVKTLDASAGLFAREEWEREVETECPVLHPELGLPKKMLQAASRARLDCLFVTAVWRIAGTVGYGGGVFECAIDNGEIRSGNRRLGLCEIELELESGPSQSLFDFARRLDERFPVRIAVLSKAERGYRLADGIAGMPAKAEPIVIGVGDSAGDVFRIIAHSCLRQFRINEKLLLETGAAEPLHQARVGLRRLRTAFSLYKPLLSSDRRAALLEAELRWLAAELGELRNLDVLIANGRGEPRLPLRVAREQALANVRDVLGSTQTRLLMIDLAEWLAVGAWCMRPEDPDLFGQNARRFAREVLDMERKLLRRRGKGLAALDDGQRHKARIAAKKLRYASQFFESLFPGKKARRRYELFRAAIEALQEQLGDLNDLVVRPQILAQLGIDAEPLGPNRTKLLRRAEDTLGALLEAKPFWH